MLEEKLIYFMLKSKYASAFFQDRNDLIISTDMSIFYLKKKELLIIN